MAEEAVLRENRANVAIELQLTGQRRGDPEKQCEVVDFEMPQIHELRTLYVFFIVIILDISTF
jgi:hypothetical protein